MLVITLPSPSLVAFVALDALPDNVATIVDGNFNVALVPPLTETLAPVLDPVASEMLIFLQKQKNLILSFPI